MNILSTGLSIGIVALVLLIASPNSSFAQPGGGRPPSFGGSFKGMTQLQGKVLCVACAVEDARKAQPSPRDLYLLTYGSERAVMQVTMVENSASGRESLGGRWKAITGLTHQLTLRGDDRLWQKLTAEENLQQEVSVTGVLQSTGPFDVADVTILR
jgi:hypothetical protein